MIFFNVGAHSAIEQKKNTTLVGMVSAINLQNKPILIKTLMCKGLAEETVYLLQEV